MLTIISWCPGKGCDPCKVIEPTQGNVLIIGRNSRGGVFIGTNGKDYGSVAVSWSQWNATLWTPVTDYVSITVTGKNSLLQPVSSTITISGTALFSGAGSGFYIPLPLTNMGITVLENPIPIVTVAASGLGGPSASATDVAIIFPDSLTWPL